MTCIRCGENKDLTTHHVIPREFGGENEKENLIQLCDECHLEVEEMTYEIFRYDAKPLISQLCRYIKTDFPPKERWQKVTNKSNVMKSPLDLTEEIKHLKHHPNKVLWDKHSLIIIFRERKEMETWVGGEEDIAKLLNLEPKEYTIFHQYFLFEEVKKEV